MKNKYYLQIEKKPGAIWEATLWARTYKGKDLDSVELEGTITVHNGYSELLKAVSFAGWYDNYLNY